MVKTRSQTGDEPATAPPRAIRFDDPPRSPSTGPVMSGVASAAAAFLERRGAATSTTMSRDETPRASRPSEPTGGERDRLSPTFMSPMTVVGAGTSTSRAIEGTHDEHRSPRPTSPARSVMSNKSTSSIAARIRQAQFEAEERLALVQKKQLELEADQIRKKLAFELENITETENTTEQPEHEKVEHWINTNRQSEEQRTPFIPEPRGRQSDARRFQQERPRSPTPVRNTSRTRGIDQLIEALEKITKIRPPPRQAYELPIFTGAAIEWFPFKAAMRDTTKAYNLTATENMARLRNCLKGEAREAVSALLHTVEDPRVIMKTLEQCFGRPEVIIDRTIDELKRLPRPGAAASELNAFAVKIQNIVSVLRAIDKRGYLFNPLLTRDVLEKLSPHLRSRWCDYAEEYGDTPEPEIITLSKFLMREADRALKHGYTSMPGTTAHKREPPKSETRRGKPVYNTTEKPETEVLRKCPVCQQNHALPKCAKFQAMTTQDRWELVKKERLCFKCITSRHRRLNCRSRPCGVNECRQPHHQLLHANRATPYTGGEPNTTSDESAELVTTTTSSRQVKLKICPVTVSGPRGRVKVYALLDEGSTVSLLDDEIARRIGAKGPIKSLHIRGVNTSQLENTSRLVQFQIQGTDERQHTIKARTMENMRLTPQTVSENLLQLDHLKDLDGNELCYEQGRPRLLIGSDNWELIVTRELRLGKKNEPGASRTQLGWVLHGVVPRKVLHAEAETILHVVDTSNERLAELVEEHFKIDSLGVMMKPKTRAEDERAVAIFEKTARRVDGHFEVGLTWRTDSTQTPPSYDTAWRRLQNLERKLDKSEALKTEYEAQIQNLLDKKYAEPCDGTERDHAHHWYLPHFPVTNPNKPGKVRLVFDAAAKSHGVSLNDFLLEGPDLLQSLQTILFRFRERPVAITADIQEMFLQVKIKKKDQSAQMFLWRGDNRDQPPKHMKMTSMIFGASSSPFLAHSVRNKNARDYGDEYPEAMRAITEAHYMDDYIDSYSNEEEAETTILQVNEIHQRGGFKLRSWSSNRPRALTRIPEDLRARSSTQLLTGHDEREKTLGLQWDTVKDTLSFNTSLSRVKQEVRELSRAPTKREALSAVMSLYDPLGLLSCYTITGKIVLQKLWREKLSWDEPLPHEYARDFMTWLQHMRVISDLRLPRCYESTSDIKKRQLHIFCDASEEAFATTAYWRMEKEDGTAEVTMVAAKSKVAPLRTQTIPRLELQAAVVGTRLAAAIATGHRWKTDEITYWTDSRTVLQWIVNDSVRYTPFVAHRLGEIAEATKPRQWRWIPTDLNVADLATRPNYVPSSKEDRWFRGPDFLREEKTKWPQFLKTEEPETEEENVLHVDERDDCLPDINRFSNYERLIRTTATVLRFIERCKKQRHELETRHLEEAERLWLIKSQSDCFKMEIELLQKKKTIPRSSRIYKLDPILTDGLLRLNGRIGSANVPEKMKRPIILDGRHPYTRLLIKHQHTAAGHANPERVVNDLRQQYWVLRLRPAVRTAARDCAVCRIRKTKPVIPVTGNLPAARIQPFTRPFTNCGVDYFGPLVVTIGRRHEKRWCALFTCLTTRAIHLELVASLSTDSAIMALRRMAARRGWPAVIYSDNGTNFRGADTELRAAYVEWAPALRDYGLLHRTTWRFIPPGAPNQGGAWERLVRSVKVALYAALNEKAPKEEVLHTLLMEAEYSINARPLTHVSVDPNDPEALTPNHFLLGSSNGLPATGPCQPADRRTWRATQALADEFWRRWVREYLPTLVPRREAANESRSLQEGDLVVVVDPNLPRNTWPRGVVETVHPGRDGLVRSADVRTRGGVFCRPTSKLAVLLVEGCDESAPGGGC